jgi:hypothetical protein
VEEGERIETQVEPDQSEQLGRTRTWRLDPAHRSRFRLRPRRADANDAQVDLAPGTQADHPRLAARDRGAHPPLARPTEAGRGACPSSAGTARTRRTQAVPPGKVLLGANRGETAASSERRRPSQLRALPYVCTEGEGAGPNAKARLPPRGASPSRPEARPGCAACPGTLSVALTARAGRPELGPRAAELKVAWARRRDTAISLRPIRHRRLRSPICSTRTDSSTAAG